MSDMGLLHQFLGMEVYHDDGGVFISQKIMLDNFKNVWNVWLKISKYLSFLQ